MPPLTTLLLFIAAATASFAVVVAVTSQTSVSLFQALNLPGSLEACSAGQPLSSRCPDCLLDCLLAVQQLRASPTANIGLLRYSPSSGRCEAVRWCNELVVNATVQPYMVSLFAPSRPRLVLFSLQSGSGVKALDALLSASTFGCNASLMLAPSTGPPPLGFWRSCWLDRLSELVPLLADKTIAVELVKDGGNVLKIVFDASFSGLNKTNWFSIDHLIGSQPDLSLSSRIYNFFSLFGSRSGAENIHNRTFFINTVWDLCTGDQGLLIVIELDNDVCEYGRTGLGTMPRILYNLGVGLWQGNVSVADYMLVTVS